MGKKKKGFWQGTKNAKGEGALPKVTKDGALPSCWSARASRVGVDSSGREQEAVAEASRP